MKCPPSLSRALLGPFEVERYDELASLLPRLEPLLLEPLEEFRLLGFLRSEDRDRPSIALTLILTSKILIPIPRLHLVFPPLSFISPVHLLLSAFRLILPFVIPSLNSFFLIPFLEFIFPLFGVSSSCIYLLKSQIA